MSKIELILTHPGGAHKDEVLACSVLLALNPVPLVRREPTREELEDPSVCVIDVGFEHAPERHNFDHHQFPREHPPTCSLSLVLQFLSLYEDAVQFCDWLEPAEWFDSRGPGATAEWLGVEREIVNRLSSPIDFTLIKHFARADRLEPGDPLWEFMRMIGEDLLVYLRSMHERIEFIRLHAERWELKLPSGESAEVLFMPRTEPMPSEPSFGLGRYVESLPEGEKIVALVYPDRRGSGYALARFNDDPRLDFAGIEKEPDVHFAHARGFIAKTSATEPDRLQALLRRAVISRL